MTQSCKNFKHSLCEVCPYKEKKQILNVSFSNRVETTFSDALDFLSLDLFFFFFLSVNVLDLFIITEK